MTPTGVAALVLVVLVVVLVLVVLKLVVLMMVVLPKVQMQPRQTEVYLIMYHMRRNTNTQNPTR